MGVLPQLGVLPHVTLYFFWDHFVTILHHYGKNSDRFARLFLIIYKEKREDRQQSRNMPFYNCWNITAVNNLKSTVYGKSFCRILCFKHK